MSGKGTSGQDATAKGAVRTSSRHVTRQATRVALVATGLVGALYLGVALTVITWVSVNLTAQVDTRLERALGFVVSGEPPGDRPPRPDPPVMPPVVPGDDYSAAEEVIAPVGGGFPFGRERAIWRVATDGTVTGERDDLWLPADRVDVVAPVTIDIEGTSVRIAGADTEDGRVIVGESMDPVNDAIATVVLGLSLIAPVLLGSIFLGALAVGRRVAMPIEEARQRQLAFTADASHELRTPLSVIEANASLALTGERDSTWYRAAFERVLGESRRMRALLEEMLWLARFDALQTPGGRAPVDLGVLVEQAADRFAAVAEARRLRLEVQVTAPNATVSASPEWIDRLIGVLLDNACRHAPEGGEVLAAVTRSDGRVTLTVDDDGPGIPEERRARIFDRFHRGSESPGGAGLSLAIADAVVRATGGRWYVAQAPIGGARMSVSWPVPA
jgi:signal transduction histidine kinase